MTNLDIDLTALSRARRSDPATSKAAARHAKNIDLTGQRFGKLVAVEAVRHLGRRTWSCRCDCGVALLVRCCQLRAKQKSSCGKCTPTWQTHGLANTTTAWIFQGMHQRCSNPKTVGYSRYGGRGITVCERWSKFDNFLADMGERPEGKSLDRIDNDGPYSPTNCRWATQKEQSRNKATNKLIAAFGEIKTQAAWVEDARCSITAVALKERLKRNIPTEVAISLPPQSKGRK